MAPTKPVPEKPPPLQTFMKPTDPTPITKCDKAIPTKVDKATSTQHDELIPAAQDSVDSASYKTIRHVVRELLACQMADAMGDFNGCAVGFLRSWISQFHQDSDFADTIPLLVGQGAQYVVNEQYNFRGPLARVMERRKLESARERGEWDGCKTWGVEWGKEGLEAARHDLITVAMAADREHDGSPAASISGSAQSQDLRVLNVGRAYDGPHGKEVVVDLATADDPLGNSVLTKTLLQRDFEAALDVASAEHGRPESRNASVTPTPEVESVPELRGVFRSADDKSARVTWIDPESGKKCGIDYAYPLHPSQDDNDMNGTRPVLRQCSSGSHGKEYTFEWLLDGKPSRHTQLLIERDDRSYLHKSTPSKSPEKRKNFQHVETEQDLQTNTTQQHQGTNDSDQSSKQNTPKASTVSAKASSTEAQQLNKKTTGEFQEAKVVITKSMSTENQDKTKPNPPSEIDMEFAFQSAAPAIGDFDKKKAVFGGAYATSRGMKAIIRWKGSRAQLKNVTNETPISVLCEKELATVIAAAVSHYSSGKERPKASKARNSTSSHGSQSP